MRRKKPTKPHASIHIVGENRIILLKHLKRLKGYYCTISPRCLKIIALKIEEGRGTLREDVFVICVFDADVCRRFEAENTKLEQGKVQKKNNVPICDSLQSIEYWFLLHSRILAATSIMSRHRKSTHKIYPQFRQRPQISRK